MNETEDKKLKGAGRLDGQGPGRRPNISLNIIGHMFDQDCLGTSILKNFYARLF